METVQCDDWQRAVERERDCSTNANGVVDAAFVNLVVHAPMSARLRNELINRGYARMANRLNELLYPPSARGGAAPNFFCFAHWASSYVGGRMNSWRGRPVRSHLEDGNAAVFHSMARAFLSFEREVIRGESRSTARCRIDQEIPLGPRVNAGVDALVDVSQGTQLTSLQDPASGLPPMLLDEIDPQRELSPASLLQKIRDRGLDEYLVAISAEGDERDAAILRGNAWLVISEQVMVGPALVQALRSLVRAATRPIQSLLRSRRVRNGQRVGPIRTGLEDAWIELVSKTLEWACPPNVLPAAEPLRFRPSGPASVHRFLKGVDNSEPLTDAPFCFFSMPAVEDEPLFWTSLAQRLPVIFAVLEASHSGQWFKQGRLIEHESWAGADDALSFYADSMNLASDEVPTAPSTLPDEQRRRDWATAHRLFARDRELIFAALFAHSLPATYTSPAGAALLDMAAHNMTGSTCPNGRALANDSLPRLRTSQRFIDAMFQNPHPPGSALDDPGQGQRSKNAWLDQIEHVHARVRDMVGQSVESAGRQVPNASLFDDPLGYEQCVGAGVSFVVPVIRTLTEQFQISWTADECDSWSRVWVEITFHQGLDAVFKDGECDDHLEWGADHRPLLSDFSYSDLLHAETEIRRRHSSRSLSGVRLADKLRRDLEDALPLALRPLIGLGLNVFGDPEVNRMLMIPGSPVTPHAKHLMRRAPRTSQRFSRWFIRFVLLQLDAAEEPESGEPVFQPGPDPRSVIQLVEQRPAERPVPLAIAA